MFPSHWQALKHKKRSSNPLLILLLILIAALIAARVGLLILGDATLPDAAHFPLGGHVTSRENMPLATSLPDRASSLSPTATPTPTPLTPTAMPDPTPQPLRLAIQPDVFERYESYFSELEHRFPGLIFSIDTTLETQPQAAARRLLMRSADEGVSVDGVIYWAPKADSTLTETDHAILLRQEFYVIAVHPATHMSELTPVARAAAIQDANTGQPLTLVVKGDGAVIRELLDFDTLGDSVHRVDQWRTAKEYVATHENAWALLPWDTVDASVRLLPAPAMTSELPGRPFDPRRTADYPLVRHLWLVSQGALPETLVDDLYQALHDDLPATIELVAVGDIMLDRSLRTHMAQHSTRYPFEGEGIHDLLSKADIAFGNLECAISDRGEAVQKTYTFRADPAAVEGLVYAGLDVLSLANNHTVDYGIDALLDTIDYLGRAGIVAVGAGRTITEAYAAQVLQVNDISLAFLAFNQIGPESFFATDTRPGNAGMDPTRMIAAVQAARAQADVVIVSCHWGAEYAASTTAAQRDLAQQLANVGATLIIGHHPHVVQGLHYHRRAFTAYSLGNFVFDINISPETLEGVALRCLIDASGVKTVELLPYRIAGSRPSLLSAEAGTPILERIWRLTRQEGGFLRPNAE